MALCACNKSLVAPFLSLNISKISEEICVVQRTIPHISVGTTDFMKTVFVHISCAHKKNSSGS